MATDLETFEKAFLAHENTNQALRDLMIDSAPTPRMKRKMFKAQVENQNEMTEIVNRMLRLSADPYVVLNGMGFRKIKMDLIELQAELKKIADTAENAAKVVSWIAAIVVLI